MGTERTVNEESIFTAALAITAADERQAYIRKVCRDDTALLDRIEALLRVHASEQSFLERAASSLQLTLDTPTLAEGPGTLINRYKLLEKIGEGGMAVVYMAEQEEPIRRKVALKIIKLGMDTRQVIARFEAERQALALMDHPNIAKVLDAGATETGRPYFVMELVQGAPITEYCDRNSLSTKDRLALFIQVCHAVQHAHQKGIIHRDIKPSNVLVTHHDGKPIPKVIDFGIAKATNQRLTEKTLFTRYAHIIGTPAYMSPEQAELSDLDIDTRTDIYSLGVLLYELLTGATPFSEEELRKAGYLEMHRVIREQEPAKPSTRLTTLGKTLTDVAKQRGSTPELLRKAVQGDLDWIVMKSLEKDRVRRYETVDALSADVSRHLSDLPVLAAAPGAIYCLRKYVRRNRTWFVMGSMGLAIATVGIVLGTMYFRADRQHRRAREELIAREHAAALSRAELLHVSGRYGEALSHVESVVRSDAAGSEARLLRARLLWEMDRADDCIVELARLRAESNEIAGAAHYLLARIYLETEPDRAKEHQDLAESLLPQTADAYYFRAITAGTPENAAQWLSTALDLDPSHYSSRKARALAHYALGDYERMQRDVEAAIALRPGDSLGYALRALAKQSAGQFEEAVQDYSRAIACSSEDADLAELHDQRRQTYWSMGDYAAALADARRCTQLAVNQIDRFIHGFHVFASLLSLRDYEGARAQHRAFLGADSTVQRSFEDWTRRYVFDAMGKGDRIGIPESIAREKAFRAAKEAAAYYQQLAGKLTRRVPDAYGTASWSPDGRKLAYGRQSNAPWGRKPPRVLRAGGPAVSGPSGIEILDLESGTTRLLVGFGRDPVWSPDGEHIAFARDWDERIRDYKEQLWIVPAEGGKPTYLGSGECSSWANDSKRLFFYSEEKGMLYSIRIDDPQAAPVPVAACPQRQPAVSPDERCIAYVVGNRLRVVELSSGAVVMDWAMPVPQSETNIAWSPDGRELSVGGTGGLGLWILDLTTKDAWHVLDGPAWSARWSADRSRIAVLIGSCYQEIWSASLDADGATYEILAPARNREDYWEHHAAKDAEFAASDWIDGLTWGGKLALAGLDQYRTGAYEKALTTLARLDELEPDVVSEETRAKAAAWKGLALSGLGREEEARAALAQVRGLRDGARDTIVGHVWSAPVCLPPPVNTMHNEWTQSISTDGLSLFFSSDRPGGSGSQDLWVATRDSTEQDWSVVVNPGPPVNSGAYESGPSISADGLTLYFSDGLWFRDEPLRPGGHGNGDIWMTTRHAGRPTWQRPVNLGRPVNSPDYDGEPDISADGLTLLFDSERPGGLGGVDLWMTARASPHETWGEPINLGPMVNSSYTDWSPSMSADGLMLFFMSNRPGSPYGVDVYDLWVATRPTTEHEWSKPVNLGRKINSADIEGGPAISADGRTLFFHGTRPGGPGYINIWRVHLARAMSPDRDDDPDHADAGPAAQWSLDEAEGAIVHDGRGRKNARLTGNPRWQPTGGRTGGAVELDGFDDCVVAPCVCDPSDGPFSIAAWLKGGAPGAVIVSQADGAWWGSDWLYAARSSGFLATGLGDPQPALQSDQAVADGRWHHVALVWDGSRRWLYLDGHEAAADTTAVAVIPSDGNLHFGAGKDLDPTNSWSGLLDEMRVYTRALDPEEVRTLAR